MIAAGTPGAAAVHARFGTLDRARIADVVFHNAQARADLEAIIHPRVYEAIDSWYRLLRNAPFGVADIPLVCETNHVRDFDRIVITACLPEQQLARLEARGLSPEQAQSRMRAQLTVEQKMARAAAVGVPVDVINTSSSIDETDQQVDRLIERLGSLPPRVCS